MSRTLVYVYDIEPPRSSIGLGVPIRDRTNDLSTVSASGPSYTSALLHQLQRHRTTLPAAAHLFFVPHSQSSWWCDQPSATLDEYWRNRSNTNFWRRRGGERMGRRQRRRHRPPPVLHVARPSGLPVISKPSAAQPRQLPQLLPQLLPQRPLFQPLPQLLMEDG